MAEEKKEEGQKTKRPTPLKRDMQNEKRRIHNKSYRAKVLTAIRSLEGSLAQKETSSLQQKLNALYSLCDKGVKTGIFKQSKANRIKSRFKRALTA